MNKTVLKKSNALTRLSEFECSTVAIVDISNDMLLSYAGYDNEKKYLKAHEQVVNEANICIILNAEHAEFNFRATIFLNRYKQNLKNRFIKNENDECHKIDLLITDVEGVIIHYEDLSDKIKSEITLFTNHDYNLDVFFISCNREMLHNSKGKEENLIPDILTDTQLLQLAYSNYYSLTNILGKEIPIKGCLFYRFCDVFNHTPHECAMKEFSRAPLISKNSINYVELLMNITIKKRMEIIKKLNEKARRDRFNKKE